MPTRTVYLNGAYVAADSAKVSIFDRGLLFGDGVYEVAGVLDGKLLDFNHHIDRLERSLRELNIPRPLSRKAILAAFRELVSLNAVREGLVYMQVTRGEAERNFVYEQGLKPTVFMFTQAKNTEHSAAASTGVALRSAPDIRWARRDIKSVNLLGQVLAKQAAAQSGAAEALLVGADGCITECGSANFYLVKDGAVITRPLSHDILPGVTRRAIVDLCRRERLALEERPFTLAEALAADETFLTGASTYVLPVVRIDDRAIAAGRPGATTLTLRRIYLQHARDTAL